MVASSEITPGRDVIASDGTKVGVVDRLDGERIKLHRPAGTAGTELYVPLAWVARVDTHVHLDRPASALATLAPDMITSQPTGTAAPIAAATAATAARPVNWLAWAALLAGLLALLLFGTRSCGRKDAAQVSETVTTTTTTESVALPGGTRVDLAPGTLNYDLQRFLASSDAAPKTFTFDKLNFDTASAAIRADDRPTLDALGQILTAYPSAKVQVIGYTDARGGASANAKLGAERAQAVAAALAAKGIAVDRIATASGGEADPAATNATASGQAENRRTELVVTAK